MDWNLNIIIQSVKLRAGNFANRLFTSESANKMDGGGCVFLPLVVLLFLIQSQVLIAQESIPEECEAADGQIICVYDASTTFVVPDGITEITVEAWGGGGSGGALANQGQGGGGGGAYVKSELTVLPATAYTISVGLGGNPGLPGGDSYFGSELTLVARGGLNAVESTGGLGGSALLSVGDIRYSGGSGGDGQIGGGAINVRGGGGGGGSAFIDTDGADGGNGGLNIAGAGGNGTGNGGDGGFGGQNGMDGSNPGGGGGGAGAGGISGTGADGRIVIIFDVLISTFYSRASGDWQDADTWTFDAGHTGPAASRRPMQQDTVYIGAGHMVTFSDNVVNDAEIHVLDTGTLAASSFVLSGSGSFNLMPGGTLEIGSQDGIMLTSDSGNIQTGTRSFSLEATYVYNGNSAQFTGDGLPGTINNLIIDNSEGVISIAGISRIVTGTLTLSNGVLTMAPGTSLVTRTGGVDAAGGAVRMQQVIDGEHGYRMISSPVVTSYSDLLDGFVTQGISGTTWPDRQPNLLYFLETYADSGTTANQSWRTVSGLNDNTEKGRGYFFYVFGNIPEDSDYSDPLPKTMSAAGLEPEFNGPGGSFDFGVSYTPTRASTDYLEGWNLVGNPTTATLDWDAAGWSHTNVDEAIYVWDPSANDGAGDYLVWNGIEGTMPENGLITPFQSFWVKANGENPVLTMTDEVKTSGGKFVSGSPLSADMNTKEHLSLGIGLEGGGLEGKIFLTFMEEGKTDKDRFDAYRLLPLSGASYLTFFTSAGGPDDAPLLINNLPMDLKEKIHIPLQVGGKRDGESISDDFTLEWEIPSNWPLDWSITLMDHETNQAISMRNRDYYSFWHNSSRGTILRADTEASGSKLDMPAQILQSAGIVSSEVKPARMNSSAQESRFTIVIEPGGDLNTTDYIPNVITLMQNYPNPFNSSTNIRMSLPHSSDVVLEVYDMIGRRVATLANGNYPAGSHVFSWDAGNVASGMYIYRLRTGREMFSKKMLLVK